MPLSRLTLDPNRIAFVASETPEAQEALHTLCQRYRSLPPEEAEAIVALGGDGFMLSTLHRFMHDRKQIYGMNKGSVGFLMNEYAEDGLVERIAAAGKTIIRPLKMEAIDARGEHHSALAINEVSLLRQRHQTAKLGVIVDDKVRIEEMTCDGVLVATPAGSTAYNLSANGPILPLHAPLLALTPLNPFRPRRWRGALLPDRATVRLEIHDPEKRPVSATADHMEVRNVVRVDIALEHSIALVMLHDPGHSLDERILREQFGTDPTPGRGGPHDPH